MCPRTKRPSIASSFRPGRSFAKPRCSCRSWRAEPQILLTLRPDHLPRHAGQVAFPGGGIDASDNGPIAAAVREAWEEVGLPASSIDPIGSLARFVSPSGFRVVPIVALVDPAARLTLNPAEVAEAFEVPFARLMDAALYVRRTVDWGGRARTYSETEFGGRRIWGMTAGILLALSRALK
jgi:8-oxo-dGTP pyrophosphatase MutT (NUDIX family)